jgi:ParB family chromosome partitioning protein
MKPASVEKIPIKNIEPNPHNPRRLFDEEPMKILEESIKKLGILVPLTIYPKREKHTTNFLKDTFVLLDGERRWRCAIELGYTEIPAVIVERPDETQNMLTMFHIHNVREGWQLMPTALKLKVLIDALHEENERKLAELTKLSVGQIRRCKILLTLPVKFQNMMLAPPSERMKTDFFIELHRIRGPALAEEWPPWINRGDSKCIQIILDKYLSGKIIAVTEFRRLAEIYRGSIRTNQKSRFYKDFDRFLRKPEMRADEFDIPGATFDKEVREIKRSTKRLLSQIKTLELDAIVADREAIDLLRKLMKTIEAKLNEALVPEPRDASTNED